MFLPEKIKNDLIESSINWKVALLFIPVAFLTYLFHESGHWIVGEVLGNDMVLSLNSAFPRNGCYIDKTHELYSSMGGPVFTILQAIIFLAIIEKIKSIYAYPVVFFAAFSRFFSIIFGGFSLQDEAKISSLLDIGTYTVAVIVLLILLLFVLRSSYLLKLNMKAAGYYTVLSTLSILLVIVINELFLKY
jgi:membrane protein DedA with SNARE-associated domain